ncbi:Asp-tRNA(Asn)/Glu-tRNA(Gln) amidotransferase subunit GatC [Thermoproteota archaeon]
MTLTLNDLDHVLELAHLEIPKQEEESYLAQIQTILEHMENLKKVDLTHIPPTSYTSRQPTLLRQDKVKKQDDLFLEENAPDWEDHCFRVPKILGDET